MRLNALLVIRSSVLFRFLFSLIRRCNDRNSLSFGYLIFLLWKTTPSGYVHVIFSIFPFGSFSKAMENRGSFS